MGAGRGVDQPVLADYTSIERFVAKGALCSAELPGSAGYGEKFLPPERAQSWRRDYADSSPE